VFSEIYWVFTILGTLIGAIVIGYMLYNAYKYRDDGGDPGGEDRPQVGEIPSGGGKGRKLFLSFALSAVVVITLIVGTYGSLLFVENAVASGAPQDPCAPYDTEGTNATMDAESVANGTGPLNVTVVGYAFGWDFAYPGGNDTIDAGEHTCGNVTVTSELRIPTDRKVRLVTTSRDVHHNIGIPELRAKTDAIPGQVTATWVNGTAEEAGQTYQANCYELCGGGHSYMNADVMVMESDAFRDWYRNESGVSTSANANATANAGS